MSKVNTCNSITHSHLAQELRKEKEITSAPEKDKERIYKHPTLWA